MRQTLPIPRDWNRHMKSSILQVLSLAHYCFSTVRGRAAQSRVLRLRTWRARPFRVLIESSARGRSRMQGEAGDRVRAR